MSLEKKNLIFSGGGGASENHYEKDSLRSNDNAEILIGLCEGPIEGLENGRRSFFVNDTPLIGTDGSENFEECTLDIKLGDATQDESVKFELGGVSRSKPLNNGNLPELNSEKSITTDGSNFDYIDVRIVISSLYNQKTDGIYKANGKFKIEYMKNTDGSWKKLGNKDIDIYGKTTSQYTRDYRIPIERSEDPNVFYTVKVTRLTPTSSSSGSGVVFELNFAQIEQVDAKTNSFPGTALAHFTVKTTDQVNNLPELYGIYKLLKIKIPSNYDPETRTYSGTWDGTFKLAWTDNPAWCLYDLITNTTYGVNAYYPVTPDKWDFYEAAQYCDEMVGSGNYDQYGNEIKEPRYTFNYIITDSQPGPQMLNYIAGTFNAMLYEDSSGCVRLAYEDNEKQAVHIFNPTNILEGGFTYNFTDPSTRYNDYTVSFVNPDLDWNTDRRRVITPYGDESIEEWGRIPYDYNAIGCIKESEAIRKTRFKLITSIKETMTVSFSTNRSMMGVNLFDTILICDPDMNWSQSGRIKAITDGDGRSKIQLRDSVYLEAGFPYKFSAQTATGIFTCDLIINEYGRVYNLSLNNKLPLDVDEKAVFYITGTGEGSYGDAKPFRVVNISEGSGDSDKISVTAVEIYRNKQVEADTGIILESSDVSTRPNYGSIPQVLDATFTEFFDENRLENALTIGVVLDWDHYPYYTGRFRVFSRPEGSEDDFEERELENEDTIYNHPAGYYEFKVLPETTLGTYPSLDKAPIFSFKISEVATTPPDNVENFRAEGNVENIYLTWDSVENADWYEIRIGENWEDNKVIATGLKTTSFYYTEVQDGNVYKFLIKAYNIAGLSSQFVSVAYGSLTAPKDVEKFYVTPNLDSLRFDWEAPGENYVEYEVRSGLAWESGYTLFVSGGNNQTVLNPGEDYNNTIYFIKAKSRKGIYSPNAMKAYTRQKLKQNRNVILSKNAVRVPVYGMGEKSNVIIGYEYGDTRNVYKIGADENRPSEKDRIGILKDDTYKVYSVSEPDVQIGTMGTKWRGVVHGLNIVNPQTPNIMSMLASNFHGEFYFPISLNEKTLARNWYSSEFFKFGEPLTFDDLDFPWDSEEARITSWLNEEDSLNYGGRLQTMISWKTDEEYTGHLGLKFNNTTSDVTETVSPSEENEVRYAGGKIDNGLILNKLLKLKYDIPTTNFTPEFTTRFRVYLSASTPSLLKILRLADNEGNYLDLYLNNYKVYIVRSDGVKMSSEFRYMTYMDFMSFQISQSENKLTLEYSLEYANIKNKIEVDCKPLTTFTKLYFGGKYD